MHKISEIELKDLKNSLENKVKLSKQTFIKGTAALIASFPNLIITKQRAQIMYEALCDLTEEEYMTGIKRFCKAHKEIYQGSNIIAHIRSYSITEEEMTSGEAWAHVLKKVASQGFYVAFTSEYETIKKAVETVGWRNICMSENIGIERAHFIKAYDSLIERKKMRFISGE